MKRIDRIRVWIYNRLFELFGCTPNVCLELIASKHSHIGYEKFYTETLYGRPRLIRRNKFGYYLWRMVKKTHDKYVPIDDMNAIANRLV